jgi:acetyl esterase/lipase
MPLRTIVLGVAICGAGGLVSVSRAGAQTVVTLWPEGAPGAKGTAEGDVPTVTVYLPAKGRAVGSGVLVCPGGGYGGLAMDHEGRQIAAWLNNLGMAAFVLKYRHAPGYRHPAPLEDASRAMRMIRERRAEFGVTPNRIGAWGFSAGGHLVSTLGTHFDGGNPAASDGVERQASRPDFLILCYPVISFTDGWTHQGSKRNLIGTSPDPKLAESLSNDKQVTAETPPTFLFHTTGDTGVPPENSVMFYLALRRAGVPAEMHIYERGPHGVGLAQGDAVLSSWPGRLEAWLRVHNWLDKVD